jgi:hypothetical protein
MTKLEELKAAANAAWAVLDDARAAVEHAGATWEVAWDAEWDAEEAWKAELKKTQEENN